MQVTKNFLVGTHQKESEVIVGPVRRMQLQDVFDFAPIDKFINLAVRITGNVRQHRPTCGFLEQTVDGHNGEELVDSPGVRNRLKEREIAVV